MRSVTVSHAGAGLNFQGIIMTTKPKFSNKIAAKICSQISAGVSLVKICASPNMPDRRTVHKWLDSQKPVHSEFVKNYIQARQSQGMVFFEKVLLTIDLPPERYIDIYGNDRFCPVSVQRQKDKAEFYFKRACQLSPRKYNADYKTAKEIFLVTGGLPAI
jgi:hypothetical protein